MESRIFDKMLARYTLTTKEEKQNATHEVMQAITLAGLYKAGFFNHAAFYGGTCLRIFHDLQRFSEDMDFSLLQANENFRLDNYFDAIIAEFQTFGREVIITKKVKKMQANIESAFLKDNTEIYNLTFSTEKNVKIKIEVDVLPPVSFTTEHKLLLLPFSFMVRCYILSDLFAGKVHALLFRQWKNRVKGRDWYDFEWYIRNNVVLNFYHLQQRVKQINSIQNEVFKPAFFKDLLREKIMKTDMNQIKNDVRPFIKNPSEMDIWSTEYFLQLAEKIRFDF